MRTWPTLLLALALGSSLACKRGELQIANVDSIALPAALDATGQNAEQERALNKARQNELENVIVQLTDALNHSKNLSTEQRKGLEDKLNQAVGEKALLAIREKELDAKIKVDSMSAVEREKKRAEALAAALEEARKQAERDKAAMEAGSNPFPTQLGPFAFVALTNCLGIQDKSMNDGAPVVLSDCVTALGPHQSFKLELVYEEVVFRIIADHSKKCLATANGQHGSRLEQKTCDKRDLNQLFSLRASSSGDSTAMIQSYNTQFCFMQSPDGVFRAEACDKTSSSFDLDRLVAP